MTLRRWLGDGTPGEVITTSSGLLVSQDGAATATAVTGGGVVSFGSIAHQGTSSIKVLGAGVNNPVFRLPFAASNNGVAFGFVHRAATLPPTAVDIVNVRRGGGQLMRIRITTAGAVAVTDGSGVVLTQTADGVWQADRWNRFDVIFSNAGGTANGAYNLRVHDGDSTTVLGSTSLFTANLGTAAVQEIDFGTPQTASTWEHYFDTIQMNDGGATFIGPYTTPTRSAGTTGSGTLSAVVRAVHQVSAGTSGSGTLGASAVALERRTLEQESVGTLSVVARKSLEARASATSGAGALTAGGVRYRNLPGPVFSYWEKVRKNFGVTSERRADELKPFWYQSDAKGKTVVRWADGTFSTVEVVTEELEAADGVRVFYGGKVNPVTPDEADELTAAGYGDFVHQSDYGPWRSVGGGS